MPFTAVGRAVLFAFGIRQCSPTHTACVCVCVSCVCVRITILHEHTQQRPKRICVDRRSFCPILKGPTVRAFVQDSLSLSRSLVIWLCVRSADKYMRNFVYLMQCQMFDLPHTHTQRHTHTRINLYAARNRLASNVYAMLISRARLWAPLSVLPSRLLSLLFSCICCACQCLHVCVFVCVCFGNLTGTCNKFDVRALKSLLNCD